MRHFIRKKYVYVLMKISHGIFKHGNLTLHFYVGHFKVLILTLIVLGGGWQDRSYEENYLVKSTRIDTALEKIPVRYCLVMKNTQSFNSKFKNLIQIQRDGLTAPPPTVPNSIKEHFTPI